jgi:glutathione reductase (NADPH)
MNEDHIFDLVVIGTGVAASTAAHECSSAGWRVSIIDSTSFGGTCALRGCEPKKVLVEAVKVVDSSLRHQNKNVCVCLSWCNLNNA